MIENIIIVDADGEFDFQAEGFEVFVIDIDMEINIITYINPLTDEVVSIECEIHADAAIIVVD